MQLFYNPNVSEAVSLVTFSKEESKHIVKVLRKKVGDTLYVTNGYGWLFEAEISEANIKKCTAVITSNALQPKKKYKLHLAVAPTKLNDRFEWFLEKATEIGIDSITPILCGHSERKVIKPERYEKVILSAMKQSSQCYLPKLNPLMSFELFLKQEHKGQLYIAHCEDSERKSLKSELRANENTTILIGPEGDFSVKEITMALQQNFIPVTLGKNRLRTETAAVVACHSVAFVNE